MVLATALPLVSGASPVSAEPAPLTVLPAGVRLYSVSQYPVTVDGLFATRTENGNTMTGSSAVKVIGRGGIPTNAESVVLTVALGRGDAAGTFTVSSCPGNRVDVAVRNDRAISTMVTVPLSDDGVICIESDRRHSTAIDVVAYSTSVITDITQAITPVTDNGFSDVQPSLGDAWYWTSTSESNTLVPSTASAVVYDLSMTAKELSGEFRISAPGAGIGWAVAKFVPGEATTTRIIAPLGNLFESGTSCVQSTTAMTYSYRIVGYVAGPLPSIAGADCPAAPRINGVSQARYTITSRARNRTSLIVSDTSGRNLTVGTAGQIDTPKERQIYVTLIYPSDTRGTPTSRKALPLAIQGVYRVGNQPICSARYIATQITACVSFPLTEQNNPNFRDIVNQPGDISTVIDVLLSNTNLAGRVDASKIWYSGTSMGGITGLSFILPANRDPRIKAIIANVAALGVWDPNLADVNNWKAAPPILMTNRLDDPVITYQFVRRTLEVALPSGRVTALAFFTGGHTGSTRCPAGDSYATAWEKWAVFGGRAPSQTAVNRSKCARFGIQPGGTTGWGSAEGLVPSWYR